MTDATESLARAGRQIIQYSNRSKMVLVIDHRYKNSHTQFIEKQDSKCGYGLESWLLPETIIRY